MDEPIDDSPSDGGSAAPPDDAFSIQGEPATSVLYEVKYDFTPSVENADGATLSFSVTNLPVWAKFDPQTGRLSGKPAVEHIGMYTDITISVSDGQQTASLPSFTIDVVATASGSITLSWIPPTQRADGTALVNLAGYKVYWGTDKDEYTSSVTIDNPSVTNYIIENLTPATYYVVATAYDSGGIESTFSNVGRARVR